MSLASDFVDGHNDSLLKALGMEIIESDKSRVVVQVALDSRHINTLSAVQGGIVMAAADIAGAYGAVLNLPEGYVTTTLESKINFLRRGSGDFLWAESEPVHIGRTTSIWRTSVWRGSSYADREKTSELTQTQLNLSISTKGGLAPSTRSLETASNESTSSGKQATDSAHDGQVNSVASIRRKKILKGASHVIMRKGFSKASVREIADAAEMPIPTMYKYIDSKEEILELIYDDIINEFHIQFDETLKTSPQASHTPTDKLTYALQATMKNFDEHQKELKLLFTESKSLPPDGLHRIYAQDRRYLDQWTRLMMEAGMDVRLGVDAELLANFVYYLTTVWSMRHWTLGKWGVDEVTRALVAFVTAAAMGTPDTSQNPFAPPAEEAFARNENRESRE